MSEKQTATTTRHLDQISQRDGDHIRRGVEDRLMALHTNRTEDGHERLFENVEQPEAERILGEIAELAKYAHAELGNHAATEAVWRRAMNGITDKLIASAMNGRSETGANEALTLVVMDLLDGATRVKKDEEEDALDHILRVGPPGVKVFLAQAASRAENLGLIVRVDDDKPFPVSEEIRNALHRHAKSIDAVHTEANKIEFGQSAENNDQALQRIAGQLDIRLETELANDWTILDYAYKEGWEQTGAHAYIDGIIESGNYTDGGMEIFLTAMRSQLDKLNAGLEKRHQVSGEYDLLVSEALNRLPNDRLRALYSESGGVVHEILRTQAENPGDENRRPDRLKGVVRAMTKIYNLNAMQLKWQADIDHPILGEIIDGQDYNAIMLDSIRDIPRPGSEQSYVSKEEYEKALTAYDSKVDGWLRDYLRERHISVGLADEMRAASYQWTHPKQGNHHMPDIEQIRNNAHTIDFMDTYLAIPDLAGDGPIGLEKLRQKTGIVNVYNYDVTQLERMHQLIDRDQDLIRNLQDGDVTVVFTDARGDHNGSLRNVPNSYEKPSGRTLFFEINQPSDVYRYSILLKNLGIAPSTVVIAAHGGPQGMYFGNSSYFTVGPTDRSNDWQQNIKIGDLPGVRRIANEFMQDSRGIDDPDDVKGRRRVILSSCSQGVNYLPHESTAAELTRNTGRTNVDVYGASEIVATGREGNELVFHNVKSDPSPIRKFTLGPHDTSRVSASEVSSVELYRKEAA